MLFLGIATLQVFNYYRHFPKDPAGIKSLVAIVYLADVLHSALFIHVSYHYTIDGFIRVLTTGDATELAATPWSLQASVAVVGVIIFSVQSYFCLRILRITESRLLAFMCWALALTRMGTNFALTATCIEHATIAVVDSFTFKWETIADLSLGAFSDIMIASTICVGLLRRRTGFTDTNRVVDRLVMYTIGSGAATSVVSLIELITYATMPRTYVWVAFYSLVSKLFSNSLLASLNQRGSHRLVSLSIQQHTSGASTRVNFHKEMESDVEMASVTNTSSKPVLHIVGKQDDSSEY
ncbi:hypothetical protein EXIGLDRAFT_836527 [Exidia glandulosa HHB12029]|uniref:DUF6534 domain-containing protein n=1 Tax=Exidia glandulosa HHB12029 TaxID=1314781 RepID=A0A165HR03_EXIGL|nr:hypothetical protein EXIGLDRAFT_836527 [Exidia glandulosa HHB12029]